MLDNWFLLTIAAMLLYGVFDFLYKTAAERRYDSVTIVNISTTTVFLLGFLAILVTGGTIEHPWRILPLVLGNGCFFLLGNVLKVESLRYIPAAIAFPLNKMNVLFVLVIAVTIFGERPGGLQLVGIALAFAMIFIARKKPREESAGTFYARGFIMALLAGFCTAISISFGRVASRSPINRLAYVMLSYGLVALLSFIWTRTIRKERHAIEAAGAALAICAGCLNFAGYLLVLQAFSTGPLSLVHPVFSMAIIIPIALSAVVFKEKLTPRNIIAVVLCLLAIVLIHL